VPSNDLHSTSISLALGLLQHESHQINLVGHEFDLKSPGYGQGRLRTLKPECGGCNKRPTRQFEPMGTERGSITKHDIDTRKTIETTSSVTGRTCRQRMMLIYSGSPNTTPPIHDNVLPVHVE
jgi:hypothetical protein